LNKICKTVNQCNNKKYIKQANSERRIIMAALVETMYSTREKPWHGLGTVVKEAPTSQEALQLAGLDWNVVQEPIYTPFREKIDGFKANVRDTDRKVLGVVSDRYKVVQNVEAFSFTDELLGNGVRYETAGSLSEGRRVWLLARLPREYIVSGERISPYLVFSNTHDGSGSVKVAITPIRVVCNNTLNLALTTAQRSFSMIHTGNIADKIQEAKDTLFMAESYMDNLGAEFEKLRKQNVTDSQINEYIELLLPMDKNPTKMQEKNIIRLRDDMRRRYYDAPDLQRVGNNAYRFINAVSDFATHANPLRRTANYSENLFSRTIDGNPLIDRAYQLVKAAA
jgi:phage/plasmid-like protein (TIGR03299 family)